MMEKPVSRHRMSEELERNSDLEDVWFDFRECINDHIREVETRWENLDDEVWAKLIIMEKNQRVAKVVLRKPSIAVNNSDHGYNSRGVIGLRGFQNDQRDQDTQVTIASVGKGCQLSIDKKGGNINITRLNNKCPIYTSGAGDTFKLIDSENKSETMFDMKKFLMSLKRESTKAQPNLESFKSRVISVINFGSQEDDQMNQPVWLIVINIVALDLIRARTRRLETRVRRVSSEGCVSGDSRVNTTASPDQDRSSQPQAHPMSWHFKPPIPPVRNL